MYINSSDVNVSVRNDDVLFVKNGKFNGPRPIVISTFSKRNPSKVQCYYTHTENM